ncbi:glycosyltransferase [Xylophilus sp. Kf1]|nr:glycosyltransferase [Xylophilus sp. Kf1]
MRRMKILLFSPHFAEYSVHLAMALARQPGLSVLLVLNRNNFVNEVGDTEKVPEMPGLTIVLLPHERSLACLLSNTWRYAALIRRFAPDVIHAQEEPKDYLALALMFSRIPMLLTVHDPRPHRGDSTAPARISRRAMLRHYLRHRAGAAIVHGSRLVADLKAEGFQKPICAAPLGPFGILDTKPKWPWTAGRCLFFGRMQGYKGLADFIEAIEILAVEQPLVHGVIAGRGPDLENFRQRLAGHRLFTVIDRYLSPSEVMREFEKANVVVLPYREATQSGVAAYALGIGRPLVVTRVGSLPDVVDNGRNGFIVPPRQPRALAQAIAPILSDQVLARDMGECSLAIGRGRLSWDIAARAAVALYDRLRVRH